jgi:hypothetical protein
MMTQKNLFQIQAALTEQAYRPPKSRLFFQPHTNSPVIIGSKRYSFALEGLLNFHKMERIDE